MRKKKLLSLALSAAMVMAPMTVGATPVADPLATTEGNAASANTNISYSVSGDVQAVSKNQYKVVLPTSQALKFVLDPQGLLNLKNGTADKASLESLAAEAGLIRPASTSINAHIQNKSSMPIVVSVDMYMDSSKVNQGTGSAVVAVSRNDVGKDTNANMLIAAVPSKTDTFTGAYNPVKEGIVLKAESVGFGSAGMGGNHTNVMSFYLDKGNWDVSKNGTVNYANGGSGTSIAIGGFVNKKADWTKVTKIPYLEATFWFDDASSTDPVYDEGVGAYGLLSANSSTTRTTELLATLGANKEGLVKVLNGDGLKGTDGKFKVSGLYYVETSSKIDTSAGIPTAEQLKASGATYAGQTVRVMGPEKYTWNNTTGTLQLNTNIVNALKGLKDHLVFFFAFDDGTVLMSDDIGF